MIICQFDVNLKYTRERKVTVKREQYSHSDNYQNYIIFICRQRKMSLCRFSQQSPIRSNNIGKNWEVETCSGLFTSKYIRSKLSLTLITLHL